MSSSSPSGSSGFGKTSLFLGEILKSKQHDNDRLPFESLQQKMNSIYTATNVGNN
jgi:hypothetical protein